MVANTCIAWTLFWRPVRRAGGGSRESYGKLGPRNLWFGNTRALG